MLLIRNGKILTMAGVNYENGYILIDAGKIVEVGEYPAAFNQEVLNSGDLEVIDAKNKYILPGLLMRTVMWNVGRFRWL